MPTPPTSPDSVQALAAHYKSIASRVGDQSARRILSGAKKAAAGLLDPEERQASMALWDEVEKQVFSPDPAE